MTREAYTEEYYRFRKEGALRSANVVVPMVIDLLKPSSVMDVGCGEGLWLSVFRACGINDILGIDGSWVNPNKLAIPKEKFLTADLTKPFDANREFDLVVCLEVVEHLPLECAVQLIASLTRHGRFVLFSAAIPDQGGCNHINEQWQIYWVRMFKGRKYLPSNYFRRKIWDNEDVGIAYRQNMFLFALQEELSRRSDLRGEFEGENYFPYSIVHPRLWEQRHQLWLNQRYDSGRQMVRDLWHLVKKRVKDKIIRRCNAP